MKVCPRCGTVNVNEARYCKKCGFYIEKVCPHCGYLNVKDAIFCAKCGSPLGILCPRCGKVNVYEAKFCAKCGYPLTQQTRNIKVDTATTTRKIEVPMTPTINIQQAMKIRKKEKQRLSIISAVAVVIVAVLIASLIFHGISVHDAVIGVRQMSITELDSVLGGNWIALSPVYTTNMNVFDKIFNYSIQGGINGYYQYYGYSNFTAFVAYINFTSSNYAKQFYDRYSGIVTTINTYSVKIIKASYAIVGVTAFGKYIIYIEIYADEKNIIIPYNTTQIEELISYMEIT
ncbi:zinc ribbon domain-containing protein [Sulfurisphaera javensis]|uniref:Zinc ribbon domain-containing protein n=1 Tax=Sulfurisphaera javensis TaxID=2049879 RepID=A0AAT9GTS9_9CREN